MPVSAVIPSNAPDYASAQTRHPGLLEKVESIYGYSLPRYSVQFYFSLMLRTDARVAYFQAYRERQSLL